MRLYLDANAILFTVEGPNHLREAVAVWLDRAEAALDGVIITSRLSRIECLTQSLREKDAAKFEAKDRFFTGGGIEILSIDDELVDIATDLQKDFSLRTIDALHVGTAIRARADVGVAAGTHLRERRVGSRLGCYPLAAEMRRGVVEVRIDVDHLDAELPGPLAPLGPLEHRELRRGERAIVGRVQFGPDKGGQTRSPPPSVNHR